MSTGAELDLSDRRVRHSQVGPRRLGCIQRSRHKPGDDKRMRDRHDRPWTVELRGDRRPRSGESCPTRISFVSRNVGEPLPSRLRIVAPATISGIRCSVVQQLGSQSFASDQVFDRDCCLFGPESRPMPDCANVESCESRGQLFRLNHPFRREARVISVVTGCVRMPDQKKSWHDVMLPHRPSGRFLCWRSSSQGLIGALGVAPYRAVYVSTADEAENPACTPPPATVILFPVSTGKIPCRAVNIGVPRRQVFVAGL